MNELYFDSVIIGGGVGGCAAALALARNGFRVALTEETDWIGGQLTAQAVPPDEHPWIESFGCTRSYREFRTRIREFYRRNYPLTPSAMREPFLNPGGGTVSPLCIEPRVALAALYEMLQPHLSSGRVTLFMRHKATSAEVDRDEVRAVQVQSLETGNDLILRAPYFLDATETGDLLPMTETEYVVGFESRQETGEPNAPDEAQPNNHQAFTCCFAMEYLHGEDHAITRPKEYAHWRDTLPQMQPPWPGPLLSLTTSHYITREPRTFTFDPVGEAAGVASGLWLYRRILDRSRFVEGAFPGDICLVNWPQNDYLEGNLVDVSEGEAAHHLKRAKGLSLSLLYWLQTEAPRPDGGTGWPGLRLRPDVTGTEDGLAKSPYIRESRRIKAEFIVTELHVGTDARMEITGKSWDEVQAEAFPDSVGVGSYRIDLHPSSGGDNYIDISSLPFQIPLGALIPVRMKNLLPACKNLGVTHLTNGCYRLQPVEWNIGESAGMLAAHCLHEDISPREVRHTPGQLLDFQSHLISQGIELEWPRLKPR